MNVLLAQLDRFLKHRGETVWLQRQVGTAGAITRVRVEIRAWVRSMMEEQLVASITQQNFMVIISPTQLNAEQWPGGQLPTGPVFGIIAASDRRIPETTDVIYIRGRQRTIQNVQPVFDRGECIRIEMSCVG
jgi:hypothetical protein